MFSTCLTAAIALLPAVTPPKSLKLAAPSLIAVEVDPKKATAFTDYFAQQLSQYGFHVTTSSEVQAILGHERERALLGCGDDSGSCMAELAGALGVDAIITGNVARIEPAGYLLTVKIVSASSAAALGNYSGRVSTEDAALDWLAATARDFAQSQRLISSLGVHLRGWSWIPAAGGVVLGGVGAVLLANSYSTASRLSAGNGASPDQLNTTISGASTQQTLGATLIGIGSAAVVAGALFFISGSEQAAPSVAAAPSPHGGLVSLAWRWP